MNILILSWRDIKNPKSGGAEILTQEIAKRLIKAGNAVTLFTSRFPGSLQAEIVDGVTIVRGGKPDPRYLLNSVYVKAFFYYRKNRHKFDVVIDQPHGLPFFTPFYVQQPIVVLLCEVAGGLWKYMFGIFFGTIGRLTEIIYLRYIYKNIPFLTISESTKEELGKNGVEKKHVTVLPMGISYPKITKQFSKEKDPTVIIVGRVSLQKGIEDAISVLEKVVKIYPKAKLWIVGRGDRAYTESLKQYVAAHNVTKNVVFIGFASEEKKYEYLARAHVLLSPSQKEGFGLTVPEAGFVGTPAVVYTVPGLRELVKNSRNGFLVSDNKADTMANKVLKILNDKKLYQIMQQNAKLESKKFSWDNTAKTTQSVLLSLQKKNSTNQ